MALSVIRRDSSAGPGMAPGGPSGRSRAAARPAADGVPDARAGGGGLRGTRARTGVRGRGATLVAWLGFCPLSKGYGVTDI